MNDLPNLSRTSNSFIARTDNDYIKQRLLRLTDEELIATFQKAVDLGRTRVLKTILDDTRFRKYNGTEEFIRSSLGHVCRKGYLDAIKPLVEFNSVMPQTRLYSACMSQALSSSNVNTTKYLLDEQVVRPAIRHHQFFMKAADNNRTSIMKLLLDDPRTEPHEHLGIALQKAASNDYLRMVRLMATHPKVNAHADEDKVLQVAAGNGAMKVLTYLLKDGSFDPSRMHNQALIEAIKGRKHEALKLLLADPRVHPQDPSNSAIKQALKHDDIEIFKLLASDPRVDLIRDDYALLRDAASSISKNPEYLHFLLSRLEYSPEDLRSYLFNGAANAQMPENLNVLFYTFDGHVPEDTFLTLFDYLRKNDQARLLSQMISQNVETYRSAVNQETLFNVLYTAMKNRENDIAAALVQGRSFDSMYEGKKKVAFDWMLKAATGRNLPNLVKALLKAVSYEDSAIDNARNFASSLNFNDIVSTLEEALGDMSI